MGSKFTSTTKINCNSLLDELEVPADVDIFQNDSTVSMIFSVKNEETINLHDVAEKVLQYVTNRFKIPDGAQPNSCIVLNNTNTFSLFLENTPLIRNGSITDITKNILLNAKLKENEIKEITFLPEDHCAGSGIIKAVVDVGYDTDTDDFYIYKHRMFLEEKIYKGTFVKAFVDLT